MSSTRSLPVAAGNRRSQIPTRHGQLLSKKFGAKISKGNVSTWEKEWSTAVVRILNGKFRLEQGDKSKDLGNVITWEIPLDALKVVAEPDKHGEFFITAERDKVEIISIGDPAKAHVTRQKRGSTFDFTAGKSPSKGIYDQDEKLLEFNRRLKEEELLGTQDVVFPLKAKSEEDAKDWVSFIQLAKGTTVTKRDLMPLLPVGGIQLTRGRGGKRGKKHKRRPPAAVQSTMARRPAKAQVDRNETFETILGGLRIAAIALSLVSVCVVGGIGGTWFLLTNARKSQKRALANKLQDVFTQAIIWLLPPYVLHVSGTAPNSYVSDLAYDEYGKLPEDDRASKKPKVIILNRCSHADFFSIVLLANLVGHAGHLRAILKGSRQNLQFVPFIGTILTWFRFLFLTGNIERDAPKVRSYIRRMAEEEGEWLVFFPEPGSTPTTIEAVEKSQQIAQASGRPFLNEVTLPQSKLLDTCLTNFLLTLEDDEDAEIYDMTVAFEGYTGEKSSARNPLRRLRDKLFPSMNSMLFNSSSTSLHVTSAVYSLREVKTGTDDFQAWLDERFQNKDALLNHFASNQSFPTAPDKYNDGRPLETFGSIKEMLYLWAATAGCFVVFVLVAVVALVVKS